MSTQMSSGFVGERFWILDAGFFSLLSFSFTEGVTEDHLPSQLEWGIVGNLSGCEIGRRHCCFDRVSARALYVSVCVSAAGTWGVLLRHLRWHRSVRLITFSKLEEGKRVSVRCPCESPDFMCVCGAVSRHIWDENSHSSALCVSALIRAPLYLRDHWYMQTHTHAHAPASEISIWRSIRSRSTYALSQVY